VSSLRAAAALCALLAVGAAGCAGYGMYVRPGTVPTCDECAAAPPLLDTRVLLIGDTGELNPGNPTLEALTPLAAGVQDRSLAVFLGDNIYPRGLPAPGEEGVEPERQTAAAILDTHVEALEAARLRSVFVPGNHDWDHSGRRGLERILAQAEYLEGAETIEARVLPSQGCPGPVVRDLGEQLRLIVIDSEWLLRAEHPKATDCGAGDAGAVEDADNERFYAALAAAVQGAGRRQVLLTLHHPLKTRGSHGGHFTVKDFFFPLTLVKSWLWLPVPAIYPPLRYWVVRSDQDLFGSRNREMVRRLEAVLATAERPAIVASGHEHTLQVMDDPALPIWYLVSGSGAKREATGEGEDTIFKHAVPGLMVLDLFVDGRVSLRVIELGDRGEPREVFSTWLSAGP
jgi:hypothetical protein